MGGRELDRLAGVPNPADGHFPEEWIASTTRARNVGREHLVDEGLSRVLLPDGRPGPTFKEVLERDPESTLGPAHAKKHGTEVGVLVKLLDSAIRLHVQVHPTIPFALKRLGSPAGKAEAYYVIGVRPEVKDPHLLLGFQRVPKREDWRRAIARQDVPAILSYFDPVPVRVGDVVFVPGGVPHAIGAGILMVEVNEPTDFTFRAEFERGGHVLPPEARFAGRDLEFALDAFEYEQRSVERVRGELFLEPRVLTPGGSGGSGSGVEEELVGPGVTSRFRVNRLRVTGTHASVERKGEGCHVAVVTGGTGKVWCEGVANDLRPGTAYFKPYAVNRTTIETGPDSGALEILKVFPPA